MVEDNELNRRLAAQILTIPGHECVIAESGEEAVAYARNDPFDAVLMDLQLPGMDGFEATRLIRSASINKETPIIALTALARPQDRDAALAAGCTLFLSKPYRMKALLDIIGVALAEKDATVAAASEAVTSEHDVPKVRTSTEDDSDLVSTADEVEPSPVGAGAATGETC